MTADNFALTQLLLPFMVLINVYAPAIRDALKRGELREMKALLKYSKKLLTTQGNLPKAIQNLERAIRKVERK